MSARQSPIARLGRTGRAVKRGQFMEKYAHEPGCPLRTIVLRLVGTALILSASGVWVIDAGMPGSEFLLLKLGVTVFCFLCGASLLSGEIRATEPAGDSRVVRLFPPERTARSSKERPGYGKRESTRLAPPRPPAKFVDLRDSDGTVLMRLLIQDTKARGALRMQLGRAWGTGV